LSLAFPRERREEKYEEICRVANRDSRVRRIGSGKDQLLPHLRTLPHLHRRLSQKDVRMPQHGNELRRVVGFSAADEIEKLDRLKKAGSISDVEFARLRARLVG
jgi:hypothetical protein